MTPSFINNVKSKNNKNVGGSIYYAFVAYQSSSDYNKKNNNTWSSPFHFLINSIKIANPIINRIIPIN